MLIGSCLSRLGNLLRPGWRVAIVCALAMLSRTLVMTAEDETLIGVAKRPRAASQMLQANGNGEVGTQRQPLARRPFGDEHSSADVLARRLQERIGRMQHRQLDEAHAGALEERTEAGG